MGKPVDEVLEMLGPPSEKADGLRFWYHSSEGITLFIESDHDGNIRAATIK
jgi:hypothetical protein